MCKEEKYPIVDAWKEYYDFLEAIRRTGVCNMFESRVYLVDCFRLSEDFAKEVLLNWMHNYDSLNEKYGWRSQILVKEST